MLSIPCSIPCGLGAEPFYKNQKKKSLEKKNNKFEGTIIVLGWISDNNNEIISFSINICL